MSRPDASASSPEMRAERIREFRFVVDLCPTRTSRRQAAGR